MTGLPLLDYGERAKRDGMATATLAQEWSEPGSNEAAYQALVAVARRQATVHADDLQHVRLAHANAWGSIWSRAIKAGIIERTDRVRQCADPLKHRHASPIYRSLIFRRSA